jgi:uncharacterized protein
MKTFAVITGASSGLGREFALALAHSTHYQLDEIWLVARRTDQLKALQNELPPGMGRVFVADLSQSSALEALGQELCKACEAGHTLRVLVNNAGFGVYGAFADNSLDWQLAMVDVNVRALTALSWHGANLLQPGGLLLNVASLAAFMPLGNFAAYAASKAYVLSLSCALAAELEDRKIQVMALCPGPVATEFAQVASGGARTKVLHGKEPDLVVRHCLGQVQKRKITALASFSWRLNAFLSRILGRRLLARFTWRFMKRPQARVQ